MESLVTVPHLAADPRRAACVRRFAEDENVSVILLLGDVTGPVLMEGEDLLYRQVQDLFQGADSPSVLDRVAIARAYLAQPRGVTEAHLDAVRFYLTRVVNVEPEGGIAWKEAFFRAWARLQEMREAFGDRRCLALADTLVCQEVFRGHLLDYRSIEIAGRTVKGVGLSPENRIAAPAERIPAEYRDELDGAVPLEEYAREFDIFVANAFPPPLQRAIQRAKWRLTILPGQATDATSFGGSAFAFESPGTFSLFKCGKNETRRQAYRFIGSDARLFRTDTFDGNFRLVETRDDLDRSPRIFLGRSDPSARRPVQKPLKKPI